MEKRLSRKIEDHFVDLKDHIRGWIEINNIKCIANEQDLTSDFLKFLYDTEGLEIGKEDFQKRKRIKNIVPHNIRCRAKRANYEQCTRRRLEGEEFCGTHIKGSPHGIIDPSVDTNEYSKKVEIWVEEIMGINYYIDDDNNVYNHEDILANKTSPSIIGKWQKKDNEEYIIPEFMD